MRRTSVLIVGGGPAGAAAAITLAKQGVAPELLERTSEAGDRVCGGFLGADALAALTSLGVTSKELGATTINRLRIVAGASQFELDLPFPAAGVSRRTLDAILLQKASQAGATVRRGAPVRMAYPGSLAVRLDNDELIVCDALFLATGKHELRGAVRPGRSLQKQPVGLRTELPPCPQRERDLLGCIELHLFDEGYAGLLLQDGGSCNLCLSVSAARLAKAGNVATLLKEILCETPLLRERIGGGPTSKWQAVAGVPYGWSTERTRSGLFRLGDQAAVIASIVGDGLGIALSSGIASASAFIAGGSNAALTWQRDFRRGAQRAIVAGEIIRGAAAKEPSRSLLMSLAQRAPMLASMAAKATRVGAF